MSNQNETRKSFRQFLQQTHTPLPHWQRPSITDIPKKKGNHSKWYVMFVGWVIVIGAALAAGLNKGRCTLPDSLQRNISSSVQMKNETLLIDTLLDSVRVLHKVNDSMPKSFRNLGSNIINDAESLRPVAEVLAKGERPLRILHIGDSHVAGKIFPNTLKTSLIYYLGAAQSANEGKGIWYSYVAKNGATNQTLNSDLYMDKFSQKHPDFIILSLGTNEAHSMRYRETQHRRELTNFLERLQSYCPDAVILMTTPPGDYLSYTYVDYKKTARTAQSIKQVHKSKKPNPMSGRCAALLVQIGHENKIPVWDLYSVCGGTEAAQRNWVAGHYMRPDRIHFLPEGYVLHAKLLSEVLVNTLSQFKF